FGDGIEWLTLEADGRGHGLASRHRREEGDLARTRDRRIGARMGPVDGGTDDLRILECVGVFVATLGKPGHQVANRRDAGRQLDILLRLADALAHPCEVEKLHAHTLELSLRGNLYQSIRCRSPARK